MKTKIVRSILLFFIGIIVCLVVFIVAGREANIFFALGLGISLAVVNMIRGKPSNEN
jgi:hypothetical protein